MAVVLAKSAFGGTNKITIHVNNAGTATITPVLTLAEMEGVTISGHPKKGPVVLDVNPKNTSEELFTFLEARVSSGGTDPAEIEFENGDKISAGGSGSGIQPDVLFYRIPKTQAGTKSRYFVGLVKVTGDSGNTATGTNQFETMTLQFSSVAAESAVTVPADILTAHGPTYRQEISSAIC